MVNTALEEIINLVKEDHSERARIAKDVSAGMVLLATIFAVAIGIIVFTPYIL
jgi:undecaprenol kinase